MAVDFKRSNAQAGDCCALSLYEIIHESGHQEIGGERNKTLLGANNEAPPSSNNEVWPMTASIFVFSLVRIYVF